MTPRTGEPGDRALDDTEAGLEFAHLPRDLGCFSSEQDLPIPAPGVFAAPTERLRLVAAADPADRAGERHQRIERQQRAAESTPATSAAALQLGAAAAISSIRSAAKSAHEVGYRDGYVNGTHWGIRCGVVLGALVGIGLSAIARQWI